MIDNAATRNYVRAMARPPFSAAWVIFAVICTLCQPMAWARGGQVQEANAGREGETLDVKSLAVKGKVTLIDFHSPFCPPCVQLAPLLTQLAVKRGDLVIKKVNINRAGFQGIDWRSPLAQQYQLRSVPYFMIFNPHRRLVAAGSEASQQVQRWLQEAGLLRR